MNKKFLAFLLTSCCFATAHASIKQEVKVTLNVQNQQSYIFFRAHFDSSDVFDGGQTSKKIYSGTTSIKHTYQHGPKNLYLSLTARPGDAKFITDESCSLLTHQYRDKFVVRLSTDERTVRTGHAHEYFTFNITQLSVPDPFHYRVSCSRASF